MTKTILAFGDSNTFGTRPMTQTGTAALRFGVGARWPTVLAARTGWEVVENGLPGRTATALPDPVMGPAMHGPLGLMMALRSCGPIDALVIMLGTNDTKVLFGQTPEMITGALAGLTFIAKSPEMQERHGGFDIMLVCPPSVVETGVLRAEFFGAAAKSAALPPLYRDLAATCGAGFLNAGTVIHVSDIDGVHFEEDAQVQLGEAIAGALQSRLT